MSPLDRFLQARDFLLQQRTDQAAAVAGFRWPEAAPFNWALDYFDTIARGNDAVGLFLLHEDGTEDRRSFAELAAASARTANYFRKQGLRRGDRLLVMLPNTVALWDITLAALKLGLVLCPTTTLLAPADLADRLERGRIRCLVTDAAGTDRCAGVADSLLRIVVGGTEKEGARGWLAFEEASGCSASFEPDGPTNPEDPFLLYFTSGTTAKPKMVLHTQRSYPIGHLSTMYWLGLMPGDLHWNISSPGWAKHAWSSFFAPWNAGAGVFVFDQARFDARRTLEALVRHRVTTLCAPPTVWRRLILEDLARYPVHLREVASAGEPLNPEIIERVRAGWNLPLRDGYGQTETTALLGNCPGQPLRAGSMGRPLPGYAMAVLDVDGRPAEEGEIAVDLRQDRPAGMMAGYEDGSAAGPAVASTPAASAWYRTSDVATRDAEGFWWFVGRADDVFKSSDYRISPFEIESALLEHPDVVEAAVVPFPDPIRLHVPKAFVVLREGLAPGSEIARTLFRFLGGRLAPYQRVRRLEFGDLPKTVSGKIRRVELRQRGLSGRAADGEYLEEDFREDRST